MADNEFLAFATDPGANVQPQADYQTNPAVDDGFAAGIANSSQCNKAWRQSSVMAHAIGELITTVLNESALDDGDIPTLTDQVLRAVQNANRLRLIANTTFYVNGATGNNANSGLAVDVPWLTLQYAVDWVRDNVDLKGFIATISVADSAAYAAFIVSGPFTGAKNGACVLIQGNTGAPSNVQINSAGTCVTVTQGARVKLTGFRLASAAGSAVSATVQGYLEIATLEFGACAVNHINISGAQVQAVGSYSIIGAAPQHILSSVGGIFDTTGAVTITTTGTPAFSDAFVRAQLSGILVGSGFLFVGGATGVRYLALTNGNIFVNGGGANFFPGNSAGSAASGGQYN